MNTNIHVISKDSQKAALNSTLARLFNKKVLKTKGKSLKLKTKQTKEPQIKSQNCFEFLQNKKTNQALNLDEIICSIEIDNNMNNCNSSISTAEPSSKSKNQQFKFKSNLKLNDMKEYNIMENKENSNLNSNLIDNPDTNYDSHEAYQLLENYEFKNVFPYTCSAGEEQNEDRLTRVPSRLSVLKQKKNLALDIEKCNSAESEKFGEIPTFENESRRNYTDSLENSKCNLKTEEIGVFGLLTEEDCGNKSKGDCNIFIEEDRRDFDNCLELTEENAYDRPYENKSSVTVNRLEDLENLYSSSNQSMNFPMLIAEEKEIEEYQGNDYYMNIKGNQGYEESLEIIKEQDTPYTQTPNTYKKDLGQSSKTRKGYMEGRLGILLSSRQNPEKEEKPPKLNLHLKDANKSNCPQIPFEYIGEIYSNLKVEEKETIFTSRKTNCKARAILADWIMDVSDKFKLVEETYFLTLSIMDRYLSLEKNKNISLDKYQLVGSSSLSIACKYEEIYSPEIRDFVYITDSTYTKEEILACEMDILVSLQFQVTYPSALRFFEIFSFFAGYNETGQPEENQERKQSNRNNQYIMDIDDLMLEESFTSNKNNKNMKLPNFEVFKHLGQFILFIFSLDNRYNNYTPSQVALAVMSICMRIKDGICLGEKKPQNIYLPNTLLNLVTSSELQVINKCFVDILFNLEYHNTTGLISVVEKFRKSKYSKIAEMRLF